MGRGRRRLRGRAWLVLASIGGGALGYVACSSSGAPAAPAGATNDGGLDGANGVPTDGPLSTFDGNLIPPSEDASPGGACTTTADCTTGQLCLFPVAEGCSAHGVCSLFDGLCGGPYCACTGDSTGVCSGLGYAPMETPLHGPPCVANAGDDSGATGANDAGGARD